MKINSGIIIINKPKGITSHDVIYHVRRKLGIKKVGHTGTLDPMATGVLPVCFGKATRIIEYMEADMKTYSCEIKLGVTTDTLDITGEVVSENDYSKITKAAVKRALKTFDGEIDQVPPIYSALKVNGKRLYEYARKGEEVEIKSRKTFIEYLKVKDIELEKNVISFDVKCSKGTYIRSICRDVGEILGCGATMTNLVRTQSGKFDIKNAIDLDDFDAINIDTINELTLPIDFSLDDLGLCIIDDKSAWKFVRGQRIAEHNVNLIHDTKIENRFAVYLNDKKAENFLGTAKYESENYCYKAVKVTGEIDEDI
ncbi:MAG: tRNA pseudouridine(55) synthase TruB [Peptostreptococcaceae bacterium]|nr:tRNA pseudouridine(55) synthase TruB [Peptostreptococcaceae bacterium]